MTTRIEDVFETVVEGVPILTTLPVGFAILLRSRPILGAHQAGCIGAFFRMCE
jgi:hypothetical protein